MRKAGKPIARTAATAALATVVVQFAVAVPLRAQVVDYDIHVTLNPERHELEGRETIRWFNTTAEPTDELWFHLYLNAFANNRTTFMRSLRGGTLRGGEVSRDGWGFIEVTSMRTADGVDLMDAWSFERPDDGNQDDFTVARVRLPAPVEPGASVELAVEFEARLPRVIARTGFVGDFHLIGQWFPKLGVFEPAGRRGREAAGWNCHQFHASSEFYADFGTYRVRVIVPENWIVGATGVRTSVEVVPQGTAHTFVADRVHDFAWTAAPPELMMEVETEFSPGSDVPQQWLERAGRLLGRSTADLELPELPITVILPRQHAGMVDRIARASRLAVAWYGLLYGPYPHPHLTVVSPPVNALEAGGMEYPMFITAGASRLLAVPPLSWLPAIETVIVHEFGHQYFQGMLASNEFEEAWLDEGLNSYAETECMVAIAEAELVPELALGVPGWRSERSSWAEFRDPLLIDQPTWAFRVRSDYFEASYTKTALALKTLEGLIGPETFARGMRTYVERWAFDHPGGDDFFAAMSEAAGEDLGWFFDQAVRGDAVPDWAIRAVRHRRPPEARGATRAEEGWSIGEETTRTEPGGDSWEIRVDLVRQGDFTGPVDLLLVFEDGATRRLEWDGLDRWTRFDLPSDQRVTAAVADPDGVWALETARADNYWRAEPDGDAGRQRLWWGGALMRLLTLVPLVWG